MVVASWCRRQALGGGSAVSFQVGCAPPKFVVLAWKRMKRQPRQSKMRTSPGSDNLGVLGGSWVIITSARCLTAAA